MRKITDNPAISTTYGVTVKHPTKGTFYFSTLRAIYAIFSVEEVGRTIEYLWQSPVKIGKEYTTPAEMKIQKFTFIKLRNNEMMETIYVTKTKIWVCFTWLCHVFFVSLPQKINL